MWRLRVLAALGLLALPIALIQGRRVRMNTPRLAEAPGPRAGRIAGDTPARHFLAIGESPLAGVGLASPTETVTARLATELAERSGRATTWHIAARGGVTVSQTLEHLLPKVPDQSVDLVLIGLGVNDSLRMTSPRAWQSRLSRLIDALTERAHPTLFVLAGVPPMQHFPVLPRPLSTLLGLRARLLDVSLAELADQREHCLHVPMGLTARDPGLFCRDGFHPNADGHRLWASLLAGPVLARLDEADVRPNTSITIHHALRTR